MPTRIDIELTSSAPDGSWTWRAAGAREPRGVLDGAILPAGVSVGDTLRVEADKDMEGTRVLAVLPPKEKASREGLLELLPTEERFEPVVQHRAPGARDDRRGARRDRGDRAERGDRPDRGPRRDRGDRHRDADGAERRDGGRSERPDRSAGGDRGEHAGERRSRREHDGGERRTRPHFTPPPELPQRPKPKRLRPGKEHRAAVLASLQEGQRPVAELALQGMAAVRQRLREDNARLRAEGHPEMPEAAVLKMAEELLPRLRVADWLDRADAARRQLAHLDLRDLRSVVAAADDPLVARDESTRELATELKDALVAKQDEELALWLADVEAALDVGRVVRALRLSSQPPKAGVPFPGALAQRLGDMTTASLGPTDGPDRWIAVLEAAAFSPVRTHVTPAQAPPAPSTELIATVKRLGPLLPQIASIFGVDVPAGAHVPRPLRPTPRKAPPAKASKAAPKVEPSARGSVAGERGARAGSPAGGEAPGPAPVADRGGDSADQSPAEVATEMTATVGDGAASAEETPSGADETVAVEPDSTATAAEPAAADAVEPTPEPVGPPAADDQPESASTDVPTDGSVHDAPGAPNHVAGPSALPGMVTETAEPR